MVSHPSMGRRLLAAAVMMTGFLIALTVKVTRGRTGDVLPVWFVDTLPNLVCSSVVPCALFFSPRPVRWIEFLQFVAMITAGLTLYEFAQILMPKRTFDWYDIVATCAGVPVAVAMGLVVFSMSRNTQETASSAADR